MQQTFTGSRTSASISKDQAYTTRVNVNITWTHPGKALYTMTGLQIAFTCANSGYVVYAYHQVDGQATIIGNYSGSGSGAKVIDIKTSAWQGMDSDTVQLRFSRPQSNAQSYSNIRLILTYESVATQSTVVVATAEVGEPQQVTLTNEDATVTHRVRWTYGSVDSGWKTYGAASRSVAWAVPSASVNTLIQANPSSGTIAGTVQVETRTADGATVGTQTKTANLKIPQNASTLPTLTASKTLTHDSAASGSGVACVQGHTTITATATATAKLGASISSIVLRTPETSYTIANGGSKSFVPGKAGSYKLTVTATDSRGLTATWTETITVTACGQPAITGLTAVRTDSQGDEADDGAFVQITATASAAAAFATVSSWAYTLRLAGTSQAVASGTLTDGAGLIGGQLGPDNAYELTVTATDSMGLTATATAAIPSAVYTIHRMAGGKGVAFGQKSIRYGVEVREDWPFRTHGVEVLELIMDMAHPVGSVLMTLDEGFDPNTEWPWTVWRKLDNTALTPAGAVVIWVRAR